MRKRFADGFDFPPLQIRLGKKDALRLKNDGLDAILDVAFDDETFEFAAEFKSRNSPRMFEDALNQIEKNATRRQMLPMLVFPFLKHQYLLQVPL